MFMRSGYLIREIGGLFLNSGTGRKELFVLLVCCKLNTRRGDVENVRLRVCHTVYPVVWFV